MADLSRDPEIDTEAAIRKAHAVNQSSRQEESYWEAITRLAIDVRERNNFRHTWADGIIRYGGG